MSKIPFRTAYDRAGHVRCKVAESDREKRAKQSFREETNINSIMSRFERTGILPAGVSSEPQYLYCPAGIDYQQSLNTVIAVQERFAALPPGVRRRFANDPAAFVEFVSDPANADEMEEMGLLSKAAVEARQAARQAAVDREAEKKARAAEAASEGEESPV